VSDVEYKVLPNIHGERPRTPPELMRTHELKTWPEFFAAIRDGRKRFEYRLNDRNYRDGDVLVLREWNRLTETYTGESITADVTYLLPVGECVVMSIVPRTPPASDERREAHDKLDALIRVLRSGVRPEATEGMRNDLFRAAILAAKEDGR
jgi:hypothetical protein